MEKKTLLYIIPHCSTGGMPQYLLKKIQLLSDDYNIYVIEWDNISSTYTVQRKRIKSTLGKNFIEFLPKNKIKSSIMVIEPDIIHFEEFPEMFFYSPMEESIPIFEWIYRKDRKWKIIETTHSSSFDPIYKKFIPDEFVFVSSYGVDQFASLNVPSRVVEYELEKRPRPDRTKTLVGLGLDPSKKHILNVGLFTPRKNQAEIFEYAEKMISDNVVFHFVGNMAENFKDYWEPLINKNLPNCKIWGEKDNTDIFYSCMDMLLFTSKGNNSDRETNPIVIKEALSWDTPVFIYNLDVYRNMYSNNRNVTYLSDFETNLGLIRNFLDIEKVKETKKCFIISTYPDNDRRKDLTKDCIISIKKLGYDVILTSHYPIDSDIQKICDYYVYDKNNYPTTHSYYKNFYNYNDKYKIDANLDTMGVINQSYSVLSNYTNGMKLAKEMGYNSTICMNYDMIISELDKNNIIEIFDSIINSDCYVLKYTESKMPLYKTVIFGTKVDFYLRNIPTFSNVSEYNKWCLDNNCHNFLESFFYRCLDGVGTKTIISKIEDEILPNSRINESSCVDYFMILKDQDDDRYFYLWSLNIDSREVIIYENGNIVDKFLVNNNQYLKKVGNGEITVMVDNNVISLDKINGKIVISK